MQLVQGKLADMYTVTQATRAFVYKTAEAADQGRADRKDCAAVILYAAEHMLQRWPWMPSSCWVAMATSTSTQQADCSEMQNCMRLALALLRLDGC